MEICEPRHEAALELLAAVESVLNQVRIIIKFVFEREKERERERERERVITLVNTALSQ